MTSNPYRYLHDYGHENLKDFLSAFSSDDDADGYKYILTSPNIKDRDRPSIHYDGDTTFKKLLLWNAMNSLNYLIFEYKIEKTKSIEKYLNEDIGDSCEQVIKMFEARDLKESLNQDLIQNNNYKKQTKI